MIFGCCQNLTSHNSFIIHTTFSPHNHNDEPQKYRAGDSPVGQQLRWKNELYLHLAVSILLMEKEKEAWTAAVRQPVAKTQQMVEDCQTDTNCCHHSPPIRLLNHCSYPGHNREPHKIKSAG